MFEIERLIELGLFSQMIPVWQVFFYIATMVPFLLFNRLRLCLLITYLFTLYLGFIVQWGELLASNKSLLPFFLYAFSGILVTVLFVVFVFSDERRALTFSRKQEPTLRAFEPEARA
jgi:hypothetical protein